MRVNGRNLLAACTTLTLAGLALSACALNSPDTSAVSTAPPSATVEAIKFRSVTQAEFDKALVDFTAEKDEFDETIRIDPAKSVTDQVFKDQPKQDKTTFGFSINISDVQDIEKMHLNPLSALMAEDWWFHRAVDYKSSAGVFHIIVDDNLRFDTVQGGGKISEVFSAHRLVDEELVKWCEVVSGDGLKVQVSAGAETTHTNAVMKIGSTTKRLLTNSCTVYFGLKQGLTSPKIPK